MTTPDAHRAIIESMWGRLEEHHDWSVLEGIYSPDYIRHGDQRIDRREWLEQLKLLYEAFPDHRMEVTSTVAEGDTVAYRWTAMATHAGTYYGAPPTGRTARATGITISRFDDGRIVEEQASWNKFAFLESLGISRLRG